MSAHCKVCSGLIFDEYGNCYGVQIEDGSWICEDCEYDLSEIKFDEPDLRDEHAYDDYSPDR